MASNIITADGKDLDSRYLAIGGKASSAIRADTAGSADRATNANYATSAGSCSSVSGLQKINYGAPINISLRYARGETWTAVSDGLLFVTKGGYRLNIGGADFSDHPTSGPVFCKRGQVVDPSSSDCVAIFYKVA